MNICIECRRLIRVWFIYAVVFYVLVFNHNITPALFFMLISFAIFASLGVWAAFIEIFSIFLPSFILYFLSDNIFIIYLLPFMNICLIMAYRAGRNMAYIISIIYILFWLYLSFSLKFSFIDYVVISAAFLNILLHIFSIFYKHNISLNWQYISEDFSELDKKILSTLEEGLYDIKGSIKKVEEISIDENIVIHAKANNFTFNIKYLKEMYKKLPKVENKRAFIIYSATFFPDMAYIPLWFMLYLKGYKVMGRAYYIHSLASIKFANIYFAAEKEMLYIMKKGIYDMADGFKSALPLQIYLLPFSFIFYIVNFIIYKVKK